MSEQKKCIFVASRNCPFQTSQVPFSTCQLCVEAWKTEVALLREQEKNTTSSEKSSKKLSLPVLETGGSTFTSNKLKEIDELLKNDDIDPLEYIQLRRQHVNNLIRGEPTEPEADNEEPETVTPQPRKIRIAVISKSLIGNKISTAPIGWELPKEISGKVIDTIFDLAKTKPAEDIRLRAGDYKIACIAVEKNKLALIILDADEEFETYESVIIRINDMLRKEKNWEDLVKKMHGKSTS